MIKLLKELWCAKFHIWAHYIAVSMLTGEEVVLAEECLKCGRTEVSEEGKRRGVKPRDTIA